MFVRLFLASATLASGLMLGNWFLSYPSPTPSASGDVAMLAPSNRGSAPSVSIANRPTVEAIVRQQSAAWPPAQSVTVSEGSLQPHSTSSPALAPRANASPELAMTRDLQTELSRLGCYGGPLDGRWTPGLQSALREFAFRLNTTLPVDGPDVALLALAKGQSTPVCGASAAAPVNEQAASGLAADGNLEFEGRMSLGGSSESGAAQKSTPRRPKDEAHFIHPLGQL